MPPPIKFSAEAWQSMVEQSETAYPFEGCGILLGPYTTEKVAQKVVSLPNLLRKEGRGRFDFMFSSDDFAKAQLAAERDDLDIVGIYHTHPDHPPRPSATDAAQPMLSGWVNVITSVRGDGHGRGRFKEAKAWWREDEKEAFVETALIAPALA